VLTAAEHRPIRPIFSRFGSQQTACLQKLFFGIVKLLNLYVLLTVIPEIGQ